MVISINCLFFAESKSLTGFAEKQFSLPEGTNTNEFVNILRTEFPQLQTLLQHAILSVNLEYIEKDKPIQLKEGNILRMQSLTQKKGTK
jgi:hypothetical protein